MKQFLTYLSLALLVVFQSAAGHYIKFFGVMPNFALCFTIIYALTNGSMRAAILGLACGLLFDCTANVAFGFNSLLLMYMTLICSYFSRKFYYQNKTAVVFGVFIYTLAIESISLVFTAVLFSDAPFFYSFFRFVLIEAVLNSIIATPLLFWVKWLNNEYIRGI